MRVLGLLVLAGCPPELAAPCPQEDLHPDVDGDGYGDPDQTEVGCPRDGWVTAGADCDDLDGAIHPAATEVCNGRDDDCDGESDDGLMARWYFDRDADGFGDGEPYDPNDGVESCQPSVSVVLVPGDCNDLDPQVYPGAPEVCDGRDQDCDYSVDEDPIDPGVWFTDADGDGFGAGPPQVTCAAPAGSSPTDDDCDDEDPWVHPAATEVCGEVDDDCDGAIDDDDPDRVDPPDYARDRDGDGWGAGAPEGAACAPPAGMGPLGDCDDLAPAVSPDGIEVCNAIDDDCDGASDDDDPDDVPIDGVWFRDEDLDGYGLDTLTFAGCVAPGARWSAVGGDCDDVDAAVNPDATEVCGGGDEDCDLLVDLADPSIDPAGVHVTWVDLDDDGFGAGLPAIECWVGPNEVEVGDDCDDALPDVYPGAIEVCGDGVDQDCDGVDPPC